MFLYAGFHRYAPSLRRATVSGVLAISITVACVADASGAAVKPKIADWFGTQSLTPGVRNVVLVTGARSGRHATVYATRVDE